MSRKGWAVIAILMNVALPFIVWGMLAAARSLRNANLRPVLRWLRVARWVAWICGMPLVTIAVLSDNYRWLWLIGMGLVSLSGGLVIPEGWVKRRYAPESVPKESDEEWWPTPRT
ncbi:MAG: hypothetical protein WCA16_14565 [Candidatus Sulfotelmatobacter sp.]